MHSIKTFAINVPSNEFRRNRILDQSEKAGVDIQIFNAVTPDTMAGIAHTYNPTKTRHFTGRELMETEKACALSHLQLWRQLQNDTHADFYLILEDDIDIQHNMGDIINALDLSNIDFLKLSGQQNRPMKAIKPLIMGHPRGKADILSHSGDREMGVDEANASASLNSARASSDADASSRLRNDGDISFTLYRYAFGPLDAAAYIVSKQGAQKLEAYCQTLLSPIDILMDRSYDHGVPIYGVLPYAGSTQFNFESDDPLFTDIGVRDHKYAPDITGGEKLIVKYHRLVGSLKRHLATLCLHLVKE